MAVYSEKNRLEDIDTRIVPDRGAFFDPSLFAESIELFGRRLFHQTVQTEIFIEEEEPPLVTSSPAMTGTSPS